MSGTWLTTYSKKRKTPMSVLQQPPTPSFTAGRFYADIVIRPLRDDSSASSALAPAAPAAARSSSSALVPSSFPSPRPPVVQSSAHYQKHYESLPLLPLDVNVCQHLMLKAKKLLAERAFSSSSVLANLGNPNPFSSSNLHLSPYALLQGLADDPLIHLYFNTSISPALSSSQEGWEGPERPNDDATDTADALSRLNVFCATSDLQSVRRMAPFSSDESSSSSFGVPSAVEAVIDSYPLKDELKRRLRAGASAMLARNSQRSLKTLDDCYSVLCPGSRGGGAAGAGTGDSSSSGTSHSSFPDVLRLSFPPGFDPNNVSFGRQPHSKNNAPFSNSKRVVGHTKKAPSSRQVSDDAVVVVGGFGGALSTKKAPHEILIENAVRLGLTCLDRAHFMPYSDAVEGFEQQAKRDVAKQERQDYEDRERRMTEGLERAAEDLNKKKNTEREERERRAAAKEEAEKAAAATAATAAAAAAAAAAAVSFDRFSPLSPSELASVSSFLECRGSPGDIVAGLEADTVSRGNLKTLCPGGWLSDEVVHYYCIMLRNRDRRLCEEALKRGEVRRGTHFFKSFFFTKVLEESGRYDYSKVKRWRKQVTNAGPNNDLFQLERIIVPVNVNQSHWCCACVHVQKKVISYYDSLGSNGEEYTDALLRYMEDEWKTAGHDGPFPKGEWSIVRLKGLPRQMNGYDCGVFTCAFADFLSIGLEDLRFTQRDISIMRNRIVLALLKGTAA